MSKLDLSRDEQRGLKIIEKLQDYYGSSNVMVSVNFLRKPGEVEDESDFRVSKKIVRVEIQVKLLSTWTEKMVFIAPGNHWQDIDKQIIQAIFIGYSNLNVEVMNRVKVLEKRVFDLEAVFLQQANLGVRETMYPSKGK